MKISKEKARESLMDMVGDIFHAKKITNFGIELAFDGRTYGEAKSAINSAFDNLSVDHPKVVLPREVGEAWIEYVRGNKSNCEASKLDNAICNLLFGCEDVPAAVVMWYKHVLDAIAILIDAYRYGWENEPEELFYVKVPENWGTGPTFTLVTMKYGGFDLVNKEDAQTFTRAKIKEYHLDSDIFTLVPVENEEVSR